MQFSAESQRRSGVRVLRPWLGSARMVQLFYAVGMLSATRPGTLETIEMFVARMAKTRSIDASLPEKQERATG